MKHSELCFRQIHLDFHTSPKISGVGKEFDAKQFAQTLKKAHVNSVTCFARCHHGMLYYDSKRFPERVHPHLINKNMLKEMIEACHERGIKAPIYITVQWDQYTVKEHPEWIAIDENGRQVGALPYEPGFYTTLCVNTGYRDFLKENLRELFESIPVDGIFMDIVNTIDCSCSVCRAAMEKQEIDVYSKQARLGYAQEMIDEFMLDMSRFIRSFQENTSIFYNASHVGVKQRASREAYTHFELESLPSGNWGYIHFPVTMRYARTLGLECMSHTGKFHLEWGDFHSFKNKEALEYECFRMLALGSKCLVGDQMNPEGVLSEPVYDMIGAVYERVENLEEWCLDAKPVTEFAILSPEEFLGGGRASLPESLMGAEQMFDKLAYQFDIIDTKEVFEKYPLLILPDSIPVDKALRKKLQHYLEKGGKVIATYESGLDAAKEKLNLLELGFRLAEQTRDKEGELVRGRITNGNEYVDYLMPSEIIGRELPKTEHVMYSKGVEIQAEEGTEILNEFVKPFFDRTYEHFCSHRQTPSSGKAGNPAVVRRNSCIYFASPIFRIYNARAPKWCKSIMKDAIEQLIGQKIIEHNGPSTVFASLNEQEGKQRKILHVLHYIPEKYAKEIHTIEDIIPLYHLEIKIKEDKRVKKVSLVPQQRILAFRQEKGQVIFEIPEVQGYQVVEVAYEK